MVEFQPRPARAHLAIAAHTGTRNELALLGRTEMEKPQSQETGVIPQGHLQAASTSRNHIAADHIAFDNTRITHMQLANGHDPGAVLVADGQVKQQILEVVDAQPRQALGQFIPDTLEGP